MSQEWFLLMVLQVDWQQFKFDSFFTVSWSGQKCVFVFVQDVKLGCQSRTPTTWAVVQNRRGSEGRQTKCCPPCRRSSASSSCKTLEDSVLILFFFYPKAFYNSLFEISSPYQTWGGVLSSAGEESEVSRWMQKRRWDGRHLLNIFLLSFLE